MSKKIGRVELLMWLNELLQLTYVQIEEAGSGAAYCQILDSLYGDVPLTKVKFNSKHEHEYINNYKVLQQCFNKHRISKEIPIQNLIKKRFTDNYEFLSWMKQYWEDNFQGGAYEAQKLRELSSRPGSRMQSPRIGAGITSISNGPYGRTSALSPLKSQNRSKSRNVASPSQGNFGNSALLHRTNANLAELQKNNTLLTSERDYYYTKLREVESLYDMLVNSEPTTEVKAILEQLHKILFTQGLPNQRYLQSPTLSNQNTSFDGIPDSMPNMLTALSLDETPFIETPEVDETDTF